jgi:hypothetical protein
MDSCTHGNFWNGDRKSKYNGNQMMSDNKKEKTLSDFLLSFLLPLSLANDNEGLINL